MADWVFLRHAETGGRMQVPDEPGVAESYEARGWERTDEPEPAPFVPAPGADPGAAWVELVHPAIDAAHDFPNDPAAIGEALEAGWEYPKAAPPPAKASSKRASSKPADDTDEE